MLRVLHLRPRLVGRLLCADNALGGAQLFFCSSYSKEAHGHSHRQRLLEASNCTAFSANLNLPRRFYSTKDTKIQASPTKPANLNKNTNESAKKKKASKSKAAAAEKESAPAISPEPSSESSPPALHAEPAATAAPKNQTKKLEIQTSKGILSITTTIEDSKINDVVFEKTKATKTATSADNQTQPGTESAPTANRTEASGATTTPPTSEQEVLEETAENFVKAVKTKDKPNPVAGRIIKIFEDAVEAEKAAAEETLPPAAKIPTAQPAKPKRVRVDFNRSSLERNFITPARAMSDFLLKSSDLESLSKIKRRSPYEQEPPITVFWRKDVEQKAIEVWGSRENLLRETLKREVERKTHQQNIFTVKRRLRDYRREIGARTNAVPCSDELGLRGKSGKVVLIAIGINGFNFLFKTIGWLFSGSHSMFAEAIHSLADTINQLILAYGIHKSTQMADSDHPYGYANMKYVSSLISGVGIFCVGTGISFYHGITGLMHPEPSQDFFWAFFILGGALVSEGATLLVAVNEVKRCAKLRGISFKDYVLTGKDPCVNVVLMEDAAAVTSVGVAAGCMALTSWTGSPIFDAVGSLLVGGILGGVASFIIYTNVAALVGKSIAEDQLKKINSELESDVMIRAIHDVKGIDMGNSLVRYKAEMDFDGRELARSYLDKQDLAELLKVVKSFQTIEELEQFLMNHGENIVDLMGGEIDRIEMKLRKKFPEIRHCDLEIL